MMSIKKLTCFVLFLSFSSSQAFAAKEYKFFGFHLPAPPAAGTDAYRQDFTTLHAYQDHRTDAQCRTADAESKLNLEDAFGPATGVLTEAEIKSVKFLSLRVFAEVAIVVLYYKTKFGRARPYNEDSTLNPCISVPSKADKAYPSGHSTTGYALALALSKKFPAKRDAIMKQGLQIGENRLIGGVHHPSDVEAGRVLAAQIVSRMHISSNPL
jgi:acid phosphatase (class A)